MPGAVPITSTSTPVRASIGASAVEVENLVATPMEQVLAEIEGVKHTYSVSQPGMAVLLGSGERVVACMVDAVLSEQDGRRAAPPTVYRALDFLLENGLVHRISSLNAFVGCSLPGKPHAGQFLLCSGCGAAIRALRTPPSKSIPN